MATSEEIYEVEQILAKREDRRRGVEYLIRWKNYDSAWDSWEPVANLGDAMDIVEEFNDRCALNEIMGLKPKGVKRAASALFAISGESASETAAGPKLLTGSPPAKKQNAKSLNKATKKSPKSQVADGANTGKAKVKAAPKKRKSAVKSEEQKGQESAGLVEVKDELQGQESEQNESGVSTVKPAKKSATKGAKKASKAASAKGNQKKTGKTKVVSTKASKSSNASKVTTKPKKGVGQKKVTKTKSKVLKDSETNNESNTAISDKDNADSANGSTDIAKVLIVKPKKSAFSKLTASNKKGKGSAKAAKSDADKKTPQPKKRSTGLKRKKPSILDTPSDASTDDDDDILYSINEEALTPPKGKKRRKKEGSDNSDPEVSFQTVVSPSKKILLKDSMKNKTKILKPVPRMAVSPSRVRSPIFLSEVPESPYKTPPSSPSSLSPATHHLANLPAHGREAPQGKEFFLSDLPTVPVIPVIPSSPSAASYKKVLAKSYPPDTQRAYANHAAEASEEEDCEENGERRMSVRQSECVFRYKEIVVRKCRGYTQVWLFTQTKIKNCLNPAVLSELKQVLQNARYDDSRLVMISGSGSIFCSGVDLHYLQNGNHKKAAETMAEAIRDFISAVISFPKLIVAAVNGPAIGLGVAILPLFDIIYASDKASFYCPYARLAQTPEACASYTFASIMGNAMGNEMLLGGRKLTAIEAYQIGLVSQVFWPTSMMQQVMPRVQNLVMYSAKALEQSKALIRSHQKAKLEFTNESECRMLCERWPTPECHKAIREYLEDEQDILV